MFAYARSEADAGTLRRDFRLSLGLTAQQIGVDVSDLRDLRGAFADQEFLERKRDRGRRLLLRCTTYQWSVTGKPCTSSMAR
jgi:hypothetical protein